MRKIWLFAIAAVTAYLLFVAGLYIGLQPFGMKALDRIGWPLLAAKRAALGVDPLLVDYRALSPAEALFTGDVSPEFKGQVLAQPNLTAILPAGLSPRPDAPDLRTLLTETVDGARLTGETKSHDVTAGPDGYFIHRLDLGWSQPEFFSFDQKLSECVALVIPGSGFDQASQIMRREGYHEDLADQMPCQPLVYVKPNNDSRQIVWGGKRADFEYLYTTLIGLGSNYAYWYVRELIDTVDYMRKLGKTVVVAGLSQGGGAALLVGAATEARLTLVLSGYYDPSAGQLGNYHQILIPGLARFIAPDSLAPRFRGRGLMLAYGKKDLPIYRYEAETQTSCQQFAEHIENFACVVHPGGHIHPNDLKAVATRMLAKN